MVQTGDLTDFTPLELHMNFSEGEWRAFLRRAVQAGSSDITIQSGDYIWGEIRRRQTRLTTRKLDASEIERAIRFMYGPTGTSQLAGKEPIDFEYEMHEFEDSYDGVMRFRVNATGCRVGAVGGGASITMRTIPGLPPTWETLNVPADISDNFFPQYGMVLIIGTTGSGKSTLLAAANRHRLEGDQPVKIITYEDPIEFVYTGLAADRMPQPSQVQIGRNMHSFHEAGRNAMRRKADVIIMGESRDRESVSACFEMALSGHAVYSTLHADTPSEAFARMVSFFPEDAQPAAANKLLDTLKLIVAQKLERQQDGQVAAVRSWLVLDREAKRRLSEKPFYQWGAITTDLLNERGTSFEAQTMPFIRKELLNFDSFRTITNMTAAEALVYFMENDLLSYVPQQIIEDYGHLIQQSA